MITTTRFNNDTWVQNGAYREKYQGEFSCIYGSPSELSKKIPVNHPLFVIEMNNSTNKILGIGYINNLYETKKYCKVYSPNNYNRYIFKGKHRIDRTTIEAHNPRLLEIFDEILFKGKTHVKRGSRITLLPDVLINHELCKDYNLLKEIKEIFKTIYIL